MYRTLARSLERVDSDARRVILARRARFVAAALAGLAGCRAAPPAKPPESAVTVAEPEPEAEPRPDLDAGGTDLPKRARAPDRDKDGVPDADDQCADEPGVSDPDSERLGCPDMHPMICLSEF